MLHGGRIGQVLIAGALAVGLVGVVPSTAGAAERDPKHHTLVFVDRSRATDDPTGTRSAPVRRLVTEVYVPRGKGPFPLIVFAHGNAGNPGKLTQLLRAWSRAGYVVVAPTFPLTNDATEGPSVIVDFVNQPADVSFVIDRVLRQARRAGTPLSGTVNPRRIGLAGHSLGGGTTYAVAFNDCCRDPRIDAVITMDAVRLPFGEDDYRFRNQPLLMIHLLDDPVVPFETSETIYAIAAPPKYLMALQTGVHFEPFEDVPNPHDDAVIAASTAFWDAYLKDRPGAARQVVRAGTEPGLSDVRSQLR